MASCTDSKAKKPNIKDLKLELVQTIFRHGKRTNEDPEIKVYDYFGKSAYEPYGLGQLTTYGKQEAFKIGQMLRRRYSDFLGDEYNTDDVYGLSSEDDRTKMTLQIVLAGLYPPTPKSKWNPDLNWAPIPTRYTPKEIDILLKPQYNPRFYAAWERAFSSEDFKTKLSEYSDFFDLMKEKTGVDASDGVVTKCYLFNSLFIPKKMGLPMPEWYTEDVFDTWCKIYSLILCSMGATRELQRMNGGPIFKTLMDNMNVDGAADNPRKIYLYSGHDHNLYTMKAILKLNEPVFFDTGSGLVFEKWRDPKDQIYVRTLLWTVAGDEPRPLKIAGNDEFCPVEKFKEVFSPAIPTEDEMCQMFKYITLDGWRTIFQRDPAVKSR